MIAWLIEKGDAKTKIVEGVFLGYDKDVHIWTRDANAAIRFCRKIDADKFLEIFKSFLMQGEGIVVTEHMWDGE